jgi:hypothetical protein
MLEKSKISFKTKNTAIKYGERVYGKKSCGARNFIIWKTKNGFSIKRKKYVRRLK